MQDHWTNCWPFGMRHNYVTDLERPISNSTSSTHTILTPWIRTRRIEKKRWSIHILWDINDMWKHQNWYATQKFQTKETRIFAWDDSYAFSIRIWFHSFFLIGMCAAEFFFFSNYSPHLSALLRNQWGISFSLCGWLFNLHSYTWNFDCQIIIK